MDKIYHGCFHKNADGTNQGIVAGERCLTPTNKCFWKDPNDVEHRIKARSRVKSQSIVSFLAVDRYNKGKNDKTIVIFCLFFCFWQVYHFILPVQSQQYLVNR